MSAISFLVGETEVSMRGSRISINGGVTAGDKLPRHLLGRRKVEISSENFSRVSAMDIGEVTNVCVLNENGLVIKLTVGQSIFRIELDLSSGGEVLGLTFSELQSGKVTNKIHNICQITIE